MRKCKPIKRAISIMLVSATLVGMLGCSQKQQANTDTSEKIDKMDKEVAASYSFDAVGGSDVMPIMGFLGPYPSEWSWDANPLPDYFTDEYFQLFKETGINVINYSPFGYSGHPQEWEKTMLLGEKYGLGIVVNDGRIRDNDLTVEEVDSFTNDYSNYSSFAGVYMVDEPGAVYFRDHENGTNIDEFKNISKNINDLGYFYYGNLLGMRLKETYTKSDEETYAKYVKEWVDTCQPKALMYDRYIFDGNPGLKYAKIYFKTMEIIRNAAEEANIPFWVYVEAGQQWNDTITRFDSNGYYPSQGEFYWNVGTLLAFGAKGVMYFPLLQPYYFAYAETDLFDFQRNGLIGAWGNKTRWFYYAQDMNAQIAAADEVLMNSVNKGVIASGEAASRDLSDCKYLMEGTSWRELTNVTGDAMVGCFNYQGKTALYVVNYDTENTQNVVLDFADTYNITVTQNADTKHRSCEKLELTFEAGESALVVFE